jgi:PhzF family phenazine biosynthesis protein
MKKFTFKKIDAFATPKSDGNPAGYVMLNSFAEITPGEMQRIARELQGFVCEVGYAVKRGPNSYELKYYSAEREVDLCGHATIAIMHDILKNDSSRKNTEIEIKNNMGILKVDNRIAEENAVFIMAPPPVHKMPVPNTEAIAQQLGLSIDDIDERLPISIINAGLDTLLVPVKSLTALLASKPVLFELKRFCLDSGCDIIEIFTPNTAQAENDYRVRVFAPTFGYLEDPATGSGNSALGYYLEERHIWEKELLSIEQNASKDNFNVVRLRRKKESDGSIKVYFGGSGILRISGEYYLP